MVCNFEGTNSLSNLGTPFLIFGIRCHIKDTLKKLRKFNFNPSIDLAIEGFVKINITWVLLVSILRDKETAN